MRFGQCRGQTIPPIQHLGQRQPGFNRILDLVQRKTELAPFTAFPGVLGKRSPRGKVHVRSELISVSAAPRTAFRRAMLWNSVRRIWEGAPVVPDRKSTRLNSS